MCVLVANHICASDQSGHRGFGWCGAEISTIALKRFVDHNVQITHRNLCARVCWALRGRAVGNDGFHFDGHALVPFQRVSKSFRLRRAANLCAALNHFKPLYCIENSIWLGFFE